MICGFQNFGLIVSQVAKQLVLIFSMFYCIDQVRNTVLVMFFLLDCFPSCIQNCYLEGVEFC